MFDGSLASTDGFDVNNTNRKNSINMDDEVECKIYGRVQGVMFRDFACRGGRKLGLKGEVRNFEDGSVWVVAQGKKGALEKFISTLERGSLFSRVEKVETRWGRPIHSIEGFRIIYS